MKKLLLSAFALLLAASGSAQALEVGDPAPMFQLTDINGKEQSLEANKGKIVVLEWTNPGCPFVKKHYGDGNMQGLQKYAAEKGVVWISVNSSAPGKEGNFDKEGAKASVESGKAVPASYLLDPEGKLGKLYGAKTTPHMFILDKEGNVAYEGAIDDKPTPDPADIPGAVNYVKDAIDALVAGTKVKTPQTRAYGCSVKYAD